MSDDHLRASLRFCYPHDTTLHERDLDLPPGLTLMTGRSGCGKTTTLKLLCGLLTPQSGTITLGARTLFDHSRHINVPTHQRRIGLVTQHEALFPHMTALQNVAYGVTTGAKGERAQRARSWLDELGVAHLADRAPRQLSGGEGQRVALARALAAAPEALLMDEPFVALDAALRHELIAHIVPRLIDLRIPVLLVTHHPDEPWGVEPRRIEL
jgi:ABC-type sulfate/molybdate transport systems ATPase subunit